LASNGVAITKLRREWLAGARRENICRSLPPAGLEQLQKFGLRSLSSTDYHLYCVGQEFNAYWRDLDIPALSCSQGIDWPIPRFSLNRGTRFRADHHATQISLKVGSHHFDTPVLKNDYQMPGHYLHSRVATRRVCADATL